MFGIFIARHVSIGWSGGGAGGGPDSDAGIPPGGFPGIFPGGGVSNSGWAGLTQFQQDELKKDCVKKGTCVMGPPASFLGKRF